MREFKLGRENNLGERTEKCDCKSDHASQASPRFASSHCSEGWVFAQLSLPGGGGFELEKFERKMQELLDLFQRNGAGRGSLKGRDFLCCFISIFAKNSTCLLYL